MDLTVDYKTSSDNSGELQWIPCAVPTVQWSLDGAQEQRWNGDRMSIGKEQARRFRSDTMGR